MNLEDPSFFPLEPEIRLKISNKLTQASPQSVMCVPPAWTTAPDTDINVTSLFFLEIHFKPGKPSLQVVPESHGLNSDNLVMAQVYVHGNTQHTLAWPSLWINHWDQRKDTTCLNMLVVKAIWHCWINSQNNPSFTKNSGKSPCDWIIDSSFFSSMTIRTSSTLQKALLLCI